MTIVFSGQPGQWLGIAGNTILRPSGQIGFEFDEAGGPGRLICRSDEAGAARSFLVADAARPGTPGRFDLPIQRGRGRQVVLRRFSNDEFLAPPKTRPGAGPTAAVALLCALDFARRRRRCEPKTTRCAPGQNLVCLSRKATWRPRPVAKHTDLASPAGRTPTTKRPGGTGLSRAPAPPSQRPSPRANPRTCPSGR